MSLNLITTTCCQTAFHLIFPYFFVELAYCIIQGKWYFKSVLLKDNFTSEIVRKKGNRKIKKIDRTPIEKLLTSVTCRNHTSCLIKRENTVSK